MSVATETPTITSLASYALLGRSGLRVSPLCLGTMTFGTEWGWGSPAETARAIFDRFLAAGGNFIDTADGYTNGTSETLLGDFMQQAKNRDRIALATKFTFGQFPGDPNGGGNGRKHMIEACEASLRRLKTDYIDLYWMHAWDMLTPVEEVMATFDTLVQQGKVRYVGLSDTPAWYASKAATLAEWRGWAKPVALQLEYSLTMRNIEFEYVDLAHEANMGITPWSPLGAGLLTGKYTRSKGEIQGDGRLTSGNTWGANRFTEKNWNVLDAVVLVALELGKTPAQVALNWVTKRPGVVSTIIGASTLEQLDENLKSLEFAIPADLLAKLDEASAPPKEFPYNFFQKELQQRLSGGVPVAREPEWYR